MTELFFALLIIALVIWAIVSFFKRRRSVKRGQSIMLSKADGIAQMYYLLTLLLLFGFLTVFNASIGHPFKTISLILFMSVVALVSAFYFHAMFNLLVGVFAFMGWLLYQGMVWSKNGLLVTLALLLFLAISYLLGRWQEQQRDFPRFSMILLVLSLITTGLILFLFSTNFGISMFYQRLIFNWQMILVFIILTLTLILLLIKNLSNQSVYILEAGAIVFIIAITAIFLISSNSNVSGRNESYLDYVGSNNRLSDFRIIWTVIFNITIFGYLLGLIMLGYHHHKTWLINLGSFGLILLAIVKYFDWFYSFMDKSVFFLSAGVLLFMVGYFMEKGRKRMLSNIKTA